MLKKLKVQYLKENVLNRINNFIIIDIENEIENLIDDIKFEFDDDNIDIDDDEIIELFDLKNEILLYLNNILFDNNNEIYYEYYDDVISLINNYDDDIIFENDVDEFEYHYDIKLNFNNFNYYNSNDDLIRYNSAIDVYTTINYYELNKYFYIELIVDNIFNRLNY